MKLQEGKWKNQLCLGGCVIRGPAREAGRGEATHVLESEAGGLGLYPGGTKIDAGVSRSGCGQLQV